MDRKIVISEIIRKAWQSLKNQLWVLIGLFIGYVIINMLLNAFVPTPTNGTFSIAGSIVLLINLVFSLIFALGYTKNCFQTIDNEEPQFSAYGQMSRKIIIYFVASLLYGIIVCIGFALLVVPGIYLSLRLQFYTTAIVDENAGILDSLKRSWNITKGSGWPLFLLFLVMFAFLLLGCIIFGIGIFVTYPLTILISCCTFRKLAIPTAE